MKTKICFSLLLFLIHSASVAQQVLPGGWITNGPVYAVSQNSQNTYVGGQFDQVGKSRPNGVVFDTGTGEATQGFAFPDKLVSSSAADGAGGFFIAGTTNTANYIPSFQRVGDMQRDGLAHILPNGEVSQSFNPVFPSGRWGKIVLAADNERVIVCAKTRNSSTNLYESRLFSISHDGTILWERVVTNAMQNSADVYSAIIHNGALYVAGRFTSVEGQPRTHLAALDVASGNLLPWNTGELLPRIINNHRQPVFMGVSGNELFIRIRAAIGNESGIRAFDLNTGALNWSLQLSGGSMVVQNGRVYYTNGLALAIRDASTKEVLPYSSDINWNVAIHAIAVNEGSIYLASASQFTNTLGESLGNIIALDENSYSLNRLEAAMYNGIYSSGSAIYTLSAGSNRLFAGGTFASIGMYEVSGLFGYNSSSGELDLIPTFQEHATVTHLAAFDTRLYVNGFVATDNVTATPLLTSLNLAGEDLGWNPPIYVSSFSKWNNTLYVSGEIPGRHGIAAFDASTGEMTDWNPPGNDFGGEFCVADENGVYLASSNIYFYDHTTANEIHPPVAYGGGMQAMTIANNRLFVGGDITGLSVNGLDVNNSNLGVIDLATGLPLPIQTVFDTQSYGTVNTLASDGGSVYIGGYFETINGVDRNKTMAINSETFALTEWTVPIAPWFATVNFIGSFPEGIFIGGDFYQAKAQRVLNFVTTTPDQTNFVSGTVFLDNDIDGIHDIGESGIPNVLVQVQPGNLFYPTDANGHYRFYVGVGDFTVQPVPPAHALSVNPGSAQVSFTDVLQQSTGVNFAVVPAPSVVDDYVEIVSNRSPKPGFEYVYTISYRNGGTETSSGTISVTLDSRLLNEGSVPPPSAVNGNVLEWNYTDLAGGAHGSIIINARVPAPTPEGSLMGEDLTAIVAISPTGNDIDLTNNASTLTEVVVGAVDPNDKLVTPQGYGPHGYIDEDTEHLTYTIRFQNVGNAPAEDIYIEDVFDVNLDESSFTMIETSHPGVSYYISNRTLHVTYADINLADSVNNEPESHGFFTFRINLIAGLQRGDVIQNSASIIFDYNLPLETNTVTNTLRNAPYPVMIFIPDSVAMMGNEVSMPVMVNNFQNVMGVQLSVSWDPQVLSYNALEDFNLPGLDENAFNLDHIDEGYMTMLWTEPTLSLQSRNDSTSIFNIRFVAIGASGSSSAVNISQAPVAIEVVGEDYEVMEVDRVNGSITVNNEMTLAGRVMYPSDQGVSNVSIGLSGSETATTATEGTGEFYFIVHPEDDHAAYTLTPSKTGDPDLANGIDVQDVARIRRHILGVETFDDPYMTIASDVSDNNQVSVQDILILQGFILGIDATFPNERHWTFVDADHTFASALTPFPYPQTREVNLEDIVANEIQNFIAVKIGDIDFSRDNSQSGRTKGQEVIVEISAPDVNENDVVEVDLTTLGFVDISAMQFTLSWNAEELEWLEPNQVDVEFRFGTHRLTEGIASAIWDHKDGKSISLNDQSKMLTLRFRKLTEQLTSRVSVNGIITPQKMFDGQLNAVTFTTRAGQEESVKIGSFYPNPFSTTTKVAFSATESGTATFDVTDMLGKQIDLKGVPVQKGWNEITYDGSALRPGAYIINIHMFDKRVRAKVIKKQN